MAGEAKFTPTQGDWVDANRLWHAYPARWMRWRQWLGMAFLALAALSLAADVFVFGEPVGQAIGDVAVLTVAGTVLLLLTAITHLSVPRQVRRQFRQRPAMGDAVHYEWDEHGLRVRTRTGSTDQRWAELHRQLRDGRSFVFLMTDQMMLLVPRRALTDEQAHDLASTADRYGPVPG